MGSSTFVILENFLPIFRVLTTSFSFILLIFSPLCKGEFWSNKVSTWSEFYLLIVGIPIVFPPLSFKLIAFLLVWPPCSSLLPLSTASLHLWTDILSYFSFAIGIYRLLNISICSVGDEIEPFWSCSVSIAAEGRLGSSLYSSMKLYSLLNY